jgi:hypothetical protein
MSPRSLTLCVFVVACAKPSGTGSPTGSTAATGATGVSAATMDTGADPGTGPTQPGPTVATRIGGKLLIGLFENPGGHWMHDSGVAWNARYAYFTRGWENNWGFGAHDGSFALDYMKSSDSVGLVPAIAYYVMNNYDPMYREDLFYQKTKDPTTMHGYFSDFLLMMQRCKDFGKPVLIMMEGDGYAYMQTQSQNNPSAYSAIADSGLPELAGVPNTAAGWGQAFLALRKAAGADNALLGMHLSGWASGKDLLYFQVSDALQPEVDKVYTFLSALGLDSYDFLVSDPLDRDSNFYVLTKGEDRWWDMSAAASISSKSFNRYNEYLRLWQQKAHKPFVLWQIPLGNSYHLDQNNTGQARGGYKDNRVEYFLGTAAHTSALVSLGVIALLFGAGTGGQASYGNDLAPSNISYIQTLADTFFKAGGLALP